MGNCKSNYHQLDPSYTFTYSNFRFAQLILFLLLQFEVSRLLSSQPSDLSRKKEQKLIFIEHLLKATSFHLHQISDEGLISEKLRPREILTTWISGSRRICQAWPVQSPLSFHPISPLCFQSLVTIGGSFLVWRWITHNL